MAGTMRTVIAPLFSWALFENAILRFPWRGLPSFSAGLATGVFPVRSRCTIQRRGLFVASDGSFQKPVVVLISLLHAARSTFLDPHCRNSRPCGSSADSMVVAIPLRACFILTEDHCSSSGLR